MTNEEKILACHGHLKIKSIAKVANVSLSRVYFILKKHGLKSIAGPSSSTNHIGSGVKKKNRVALSAVERQNKLKEVVKELESKYY